MISVIIPIYNKENYIAETIQSVLNQTFSNFELILVNDGSTDNSLNIIKSFNDDRIVILDIDNSGVSNARNQGVKKAKYNFIAFLDADDWWDKTYLQEIIKLINKYNANNIFATGRCRVFNNNIDYYENEYLPNKNEIGFIDYYQVISKYLPPINSSNVVIRKDVLNATGIFNVNQKLHEDHDLWLRICVENTIVFINKNLSYYRKDISNSLSSKFYEANDFLTYINTFVDVNNRITQKRKDSFKKYYQRFILLTFIKNYKHYSSKESKKILQKVKCILDSRVYFMLMILHVFPYKNTYSILKKIKSYA